MVGAPLLLFWVMQAGSPEPLPRRFAFAVGENQGAGRDERLRYAVADAQRTLEVLREVAGVRGEDSTLLAGADASSLRAALGQLEQRLAAEAAPQDQLFVYVSAHAAQGELRLNGTFFPLRELEAFVRRAPVAVALLIVDSCRSGALTREKGLVPLEGTSVSFEPTDVQGRVIITSSGADESSQESDALMGSYFTQHLLSGMRGAADRSRDGKITLDEAYAYAYARTVESTFATRAGSQHPSYAVDLKGRGELVLAELSRASGRLTVDVQTGGEWLVLDEKSGGVVGQFYKDEGPATFAVPAGAYRVRARVDEGHREARVVVPAGGAARVEASVLTQGAMIRAPRKGAGRALWSLSVAAVLGTASVPGTHPLAGIQARARYWPLESLLFLHHLSVWAGYRAGGAPGVGDFLQHEWDVTVGAGHTFGLGPLDLHVSLDGGAVIAAQQGLEAAQRRVALQPQARGSLELEWLPFRPVALSLGAHAGVVWANLVGRGIAPAFRGSLTLGLTLDL